MYSDTFFDGSTSGTGGTTTATLSTEDRAKLDAIPTPTLNQLPYALATDVEALSTSVSDMGSAKIDRDEALATFPKKDAVLITVQGDIGQSKRPQVTLSREVLSNRVVCLTSLTDLEGFNIGNPVDLDTDLQQPTPKTFETTDAGQSILLINQHATWKIRFGIYRWGRVGTSWSHGVIGNVFNVNVTVSDTYTWPSTGINGKVFPTTVVTLFHIEPKDQVLVTYVGGNDFVIKSMRANAVNVDALTIWKNIHDPIILNGETFRLNATMDITALKNWQTSTQSTLNSLVAVTSRTVVTLTTGRTGVKDDLQRTLLFSDHTQNVTYTLPEDMTGTGTNAMAWTNNNSSLQFVNNSDTWFLTIATTGTDYTLVSFNNWRKLAPRGVAVIVKINNTTYMLTGDLVA